MVRIKTIPFDDQAVNKARGITQAIQYPSVYILTGAVTQKGNNRKRYSLFIMKQTLSNSKEKKSKGELTFKGNKSKISAIKTFFLV